MDPNPFDQFDNTPTTAAPPAASTGGANPFDAFDGQHAGASSAMHTYAARKPDGTTVQFQLPEDAPDDLVRQHAAQAVGDDRYLHADVKRDGSPLPATDHSAMTGFEGGVEQPINKGAQFLENIPVLGDGLKWFDHLFGGSTAEEAGDHNAQVRANNSRTGFQTAGNIIGTLPTMELPGGLLAQGAASGALLSNHKDAAGIATDSVMGAGESYAGGKALSGLSGVIAPHLTAAQQALRDVGVQLTPGQLFGGVLKHLEDGATHLPFLGDAITAARNKGLGQFNRGAVNDSLSHIGETLPDTIETGHGAIGYTKRAFGNMYDKTLAQTRIVPDQQFAQDLANVSSKATDGTLGKDAADQLNNTYKSVVLQRLRSGQPIAGPDVKSMVSELRVRAGQAQDPAYKSALSDMAFAVRSAAMRSSSPQVAGDLANADAGYAKFAVLRKAAAAPEGGVFTPAQLQTASRMNDTSIGKGASATGDALMQDYAGAGRDVLPSKVGDSGTALRNLIGGVGAAAAGGVVNFPATAMAGAGLGVGSAAYSPPAIKLLNATLGRTAGAGAQKTADLLRLLAPLVSAATVPAAVGATGR